MTDFSHLHALEDRLHRAKIRRRDANSEQTIFENLCVQQIEKEIADEKTFLGLNIEISNDDLVKALTS